MKFEQAQRDVLMPWSFGFSYNNLYLQQIVSSPFPVLAHRS